MSVTNPVTGHSMTLDDARDRFEENKSDADRQSDYVMVAAEYYRDDMIEPSTFTRVLAQVSIAVMGVNREPQVR